MLRRKAFNCATQINRNFQTLSCVNLPWDMGHRDPGQPFDLDPVNGEKRTPAFSLQLKTRLLEMEKQICYNTNTVVRPGLPQTIAESSSNQALVSDLANKFRDIIMDTAWFHVDRENIYDPRNLATIRHHLMPRILNGLRTAICTHPDISLEKILSTNSTSRPHLCASWESRGEKFQLRGPNRLSELIYSKEMQPLFANEDEVNSTTNEDIVWDDVISPHFDMHKRLVRFKNESPFNTSSDTKLPFPHPHTLLNYTKPMRVYKTQVTGRSILYCFATTMTHAIEGGAEMGEPLTSPVPVKMLVFDGTSFHFVCFQLNTLDFSDEAGVKNIAWVDSENELYYHCGPSEDANRKAEQVVYEKTIGNSLVTLQGFQEETAEKLIKFLLY